MKLLFSIGMGLILFMVQIPPIQAGPLLSLNSPSDLNNLVSGQKVTFEVSLSGLNAGDLLFYLSADIKYDPTIFSAPTAIDQGSIIPDASGFLGFGFSDEVGAIYDNIGLPPLPPITRNGTFFTFEVTAIGAGKGSVEFSFVDSTGEDNSGSLLNPASGGALVEINVQPSSVPEPGSIALFLFGTGICGIARCFRRGKSRKVRTGPVNQGSLEN